MNVGHYRYIKQLQQGGMGTVWLVQDTFTNAVFVMKVCTHIREAQMLMELHHPGIPKIYAYQQVHEKIYILMDFIKGKTLSEVIQEQGNVKESDVLYWMLQVIEIINYLHKKNILYCDMKPENIILSAKGTIHLLDFGTAMNKDKQDNVHYGTIGYAASEQYEEGILDERVDIYGIAKVMIALLSGIYNGEEIQNLNLSQINISKDLRNILIRCIDEDREKRYSNMSLFKQAIETYLMKKRIHTTIKELRCLLSQMVRV